MLKKSYQKALVRLASGVVYHFQPQRKFSFPSKVTLIPVIDINVGFSYLTTIVTTCRFYLFHKHPPGSEPNDSMIRMLRELYITSIWLFRPFITFEFSLYAFTEFAEFSDKNICCFHKRVQNLPRLVLETRMLPQCH